MVGKYCRGWNVSSMIWMYEYFQGLKDYMWYISGLRGLYTF